MIPERYSKYNPVIFSKGRRGLIYIFKKNKTVFALKIKNPNSNAYFRIENEGKFLQLLNKYNIGPKLVDFSQDFVCYKFINGVTLKDYIKNNKNIFNVLKSVEEQCKVLDELNINKEEMHKPLKNIIVKNKKPILIDFERCHFTSRPKNVNQFKEFLRRIKWKGL